MKLWSPQDDDWLKANYATSNNGEIAIRFGRSRQAIMLRAIHLGLRKSKKMVHKRCIKPSIVSPSLERQIVSLYKEGRSAAEIREAIGRVHSRNWVERLLKSRGLTRSFMEIAALRTYRRIGTKKGKLTMIKPLTQKGIYGLYWECKCDCGQKTKIHRDRLRGGASKQSCGCDVWRTGAESHNWLGHEEVSMTFLNRYQGNAKTKGLPFVITTRHVWDLYLKQRKRCALTGLPITFDARATSPDTTVSIDRIRNDTGYTPDNIQLVHKWVNILKAGFDDDDLFKVVKAIYEHKNLSKLEMTEDSLEKAVNQIPFPTRKRNQKAAIAA